MDRIEAPRFIEPDAGARNVEIRMQEKPASREARP